MTTDKNCCANCKFWYEVGNPNEEINECRRKAPSPGSGAMPKWPLTKASTWCGEHELIKEIK